MAQTSSTTGLVLTEEQNTSSSSLCSYSSLTSSSFPYSEPDSEATVRPCRSDCGGMFELEFTRIYVQHREHTVSQSGLSNVLSVHAEIQATQQEADTDELSEAESEERTRHQQHRRSVRFAGPSRHLDTHPQMRDSGAYTFSQNHSPKPTGAIRDILRDSKTANTIIRDSGIADTAFKEDEAVRPTARQITRRPRREPARSPPRMQRMPARRPPPTPRNLPAATTKPIGIPLPNDGQPNSLRRELLEEQDPCGDHYLRDGTEVRMLPNKFGEEMPTPPDSEFVRILRERIRCVGLDREGI